MRLFCAKPRINMLTKNIKISFDNPTKSPDLRKYPLFRMRRRESFYYFERTEKPSLINNDDNDNLFICFFIKYC